jgi:hypothetical protein
MHLRACRLEKKLASQRLNAVKVSSSGLALSWAAGSRRASEASEVEPRFFTKRDILVGEGGHTAGH